MLIARDAPLASPSAVAVALVAVAAGLAYMRREPAVPTFHWLVVLGSIGIAYGLFFGPTEHGRADGVLLAIYLVTMYFVVSQWWAEVPDEATAENE